MSSQAQNYFHIARSLRKPPPTRSISASFGTLPNIANQSFESLKSLSSSFPDSITFISSHSSSIWPWVRYFLDVAGNEVNAQARSHDFMTQIHIIFRIVLSLVHINSRSSIHLPAPRYAPVLASLWFFCITETNTEELISISQCMVPIIAAVPNDFKSALSSAMPSDTVEKCLDRLVDEISQWRQRRRSSLAHMHALLTCITGSYIDDEKHETAIKAVTTIDVILSALGFFVSEVKPRHSSDPTTKLARLQCLERCLLFLAMLFTAQGAFGYAYALQRHFLSRFFRAFRVLVSEYAFTHDELSPLRKDFIVSMVKDLQKFSIHRSVARALKKSVREVVNSRLVVPHDLGMNEEWVKLKDLTESGLFAEWEAAFQQSIPSTCSYAECTGEYRTTKIPFLCSRCTGSVYCSRYCQKEAYATHRSYCHEVKRKRDESLSFWMLTPIDITYFTAAINHDSSTIYLSEIRRALQDYCNRHQDETQLTVVLDYSNVPCSVSVRKREESDYEFEGGIFLRDERIILNGVIPVGDVFGQCVMRGGPLSLGDEETTEL